MIISACVYTVGEKCPFSFFASYELEDDFDLSEIDSDFISGYIDRSSLGDSFYEVMNNEPERDIIELIKKESEYPTLKDLTREDFEKYVEDFVSKTLITSEMAYYVDDEKIVDTSGTHRGEWDKLIFSQMTYSVLRQLNRILREK